MPIFQQAKAVLTGDKTVTRRCIEPGDFFYASVDDGVAGNPQPIEPVIMTQTVEELIPTIDQVGSLRVLTWFRNGRVKAKIGQLQPIVPKRGQSSYFLYRNVSEVVKVADAGWVSAHEDYVDPGETDYDHAKWQEQWAGDGGGTWQERLERWGYTRQYIRITAMRVERLQSITHADALAEGTKSVDAYCELWEKINGSVKGKRWQDNPLIVVQCFERAVDE